MLPANSSTSALGAALDTAYMESPKLRLSLILPANRPRGLILVNPPPITQGLEIWGRVWCVNGQTETEGTLPFSASVFSHVK